ncbi:fused MFS/spermidine synthase [Nocardioides euryhalodurans]|uniref:Spermidine synthase n=1 Tax=Nocardioides euryhalodurans TaxID=2518370 RepID=A0A4V1BDM1_9ACTN|nr:fused MFS/spermidine synthase [Nocardioides euryhalodurans]QBR91602.1 spermidine synthase [Nocardioides euryhalodurans]
MEQPVTREPAGLGPWAAGALVFGSSGAVLVVELASLRLLAPYLGLTLETNTLVIGLALAAIAAGAWLGGRAADRFPPRVTLAPLLGMAGGAVALMPGLVRWAGATGDPSLLFWMSAAAIVVPAALLSAVTPMVTKLRLTSLDETGTVVGRLSGIGTVGAIAGTVLTGFVLITLVPVSTILVGLGVLLLVSSVVVDLRVRGWRGRAVAAAVVAAGGLAAVTAPGGCDVETTYHCAVVETDPANASGRLLIMDGVNHSYVDLDDPTHLDFEYVRAIASLTDTAYADGEPLRAHHLGGGGLTVPRYLDEVRPGTDSMVSEIDAGVVELDVDRLGLELGGGIEVRVEDGRTGLRRVADGSQDLVVGDAFGGVSIPFHLTTTEAMEEVGRVLADDGLYVANLIDHGPLDFARAELATLLARFDHVALAARPEVLAGQGGGNLVAVAGDRPVDLAAWEDRMAERDNPWATISGEQLAAFVGDAMVLSDDHAPVDQLLTPYE